MKTSPVFPQASGGTPLQARRSRHSLADGNLKEDLIQRHLDVQKEFETLQPLHQKLGKDVQKKKESYVRREVSYKSQISHIKDMLEKTVLCRGGDEASMPAIRKMHKEASIPLLSLPALAMPMPDKRALTLCPTYPFAKKCFGRWWFAHSPGSRLWPTVMKCKRGGTVL